LADKFRRVEIQGVEREDRVHAADLVHRMRSSERENVAEPRSTDGDRQLGTARSFGEGVRGEVSDLPVPVVIDEELRLLDIAAARLNGLFAVTSEKEKNHGTRDEEGRAFHEPLLGR